MAKPMFPEEAIALARLGVKADEGNTVSHSVSLHTAFLPELLKYTGAELHSHFAMEHTGLMGDAIVAFRGPAEVKEHLVDMEDRQNNDLIRSADMLHFIVEHFGMPLAEAVVRQRLLISGIVELMASATQRVRRTRNVMTRSGHGSERSEESDEECRTSVSTQGGSEWFREGESASQREAARRDGDDIFVGERKLSVSIATVSPVSAMIHIGLNIDPHGAPVPAIGLTELGVNPQPFGVSIMEWYALEHQSMANARVKVKGVR